MQTVTVAGRERRLTWKPPTAEHRALRANKTLGVTPQSKGFAIAHEINLKKYFPVLDQLDVGDCVDFAVEQSAERVLRKYNVIADSEPRPYLSPVDLYKRVRRRSGTPLTEDTGSTVTEALIAVTDEGVARTSIVPIIGTEWEKPITQEAEADAAKHKVLDWYALSSHEWIQASLTLEFSSPFGMQLPKTFNDIGNDGYLPLPPIGVKFIGGHAMQIIGYRRRSNGKVDYLVLNQWGLPWGCFGQTFLGENIDGCFWLPEEYFDILLADEASTIHRVAA